MRILTLSVASLALAAGGCATTDGNGSGGAVGAAATLMNASGARVGAATITPVSGGLRVMVTATGLTPGNHGVHIHTTGMCEAPGFTTAGGHWNPTGMKHGSMNPMGPHEGDLPNLVVGADGAGSVTYTVKGAGMTGPTGLLDSDGAAVVIHAGPDDLMTDPSGNSGGRVACGVLS
ncbi:superoxide dismutase family protein [soil metagenome]